MATSRRRTTTSDILGVLKTSPEYDKYMREVSNDLIDAAKHAFRQQEDKTNQNPSDWSPPRYLASFGVERGAPIPSRRAKKPLPEEVRELTFVVFNDDSDAENPRMSNALAVEFGAYSATSKSGTRLKYRPLGLGISTLVNRAS